MPLLPQTPGFIPLIPIAAPLAPAVPVAVGTGVALGAEAVGAMAGAILGGGLIAGGAAALVAGAAQLWGLLAGRPRGVAPTGTIDWEGSINKTGTTTLKIYRGAVPTPSGSTACNKMNNYVDIANVYATITIAAKTSGFEVKPSTAKSTTCPANPQRQELWYNGELRTSFDAGTWGTPFWFPRLVAGGGAGGDTYTPPVMSGYVPPELDPEPAVAPQPARVPLLPGVPVRVIPAEPVTQPDPAPGKTPASPAVKPAIPAAPAYAPVGVPESRPIRDGQVVAPVPAPIPVTPADVVFPVPGGAPVGGPGQSPKPDLVGIAQEVGKIERKLEGLLNPRDPAANPVPEWLNDLGDGLGMIGRLWDLFSALQSGGKYVLTEPCDPDGDGKFVRREIEYQGALGMLGVLNNKIDALAQLQQAAKDLRQPICPGRKPWGELVSVRFVSLENSSAGERPLRKEFRYRDQTLSDQCAHANHWEGFEWQAGPYCVRSTRLSWGEPQVWAATPGEGKRVIGHAAAIAGVDLNDPKHRWSVSTSQNPRYGRSGRMVPARKALNSIWVTKRDGPSGLPEFPISV